MAMTSEAGLAENEIRRLIARYSDAVNRRDAASWGATWAEDGEWVLLGTTTRGKGAIVARWLELMEGIPFVLQVPGFGLVDFPQAEDHETATGRWYITEISNRPTGSASLVGVYHDRYVREKGGWVFASRRFDILYSNRDAPGAVTTAIFPEDIDA